MGLTHKNRKKIPNFSIVSQITKVCLDSMIDIYCKDSQVGALNSELMYISDDLKLKLRFLG